MVRLPSDTQRTTIIGRTGSGKTVAGLWHLSRVNFDRMPYVVYDFKGDDLIGDIEQLEGVNTIPVTEVPKHPGIYVVHPRPDESDLVESQLWQIWERGRTGIYVDEGYMMVPDGRRNYAFRSILTQGRSKRIPLITLSQRPVWLDRFTFSESDFYQIFFLNHSGDRRKIMEYVPADLTENLPTFHSYYHDVGRGETVVFRPVPTGDKILAAIDKRLEPLRHRPKRRLI